MEINLFEVDDNDGRNEDNFYQYIHKALSLSLPHTHIHTQPHTLSIAIHFDETVFLNVYLSGSEKRVSAMNTDNKMMYARTQFQFGTFLCARHREPNKYLFRFSFVCTQNN